MRTLAERLKAVEDELSIRNLVARFTDAVNQRDIAGFRELWTDDAVWEIGPPLQSRAEVSTSAGDNLAMNWRIGFRLNVSSRNESRAPLQ